MELLIVRDSARIGGAMNTYKQYDEDGIKTTVCSSDIFGQLPSMSFDLIIIDLVKATLENGNFGFLQSLQLQAYHAAIAIADESSRSGELQEILKSMGVCSFVQRPVNKETFFEQVDCALRESKRRFN
ncbi:hypothetical protein [Novisyntrophococcus fermenticellae]|uniref:hypothetical protein n=1 Tax=Novisyntrophococcus fermenticellae TaxID=2068655 RepID=UPI001E3FC7EE|nr:hypothetical protein [Novisyntrophococcus fermenticellae]